MSELLLNVKPYPASDDVEAVSTTVVSCVKSARDTMTQDYQAEEIIEVIRTDKQLSERIENIRHTFESVMATTGNDRKAAKEAVAEDKKKLPGVLWSGQFRNRNGSDPDKLLQHSGLLCADIDDLGERVAEVRAKLLTSSNLWALFVSPTGDGLKCVFRVTADAERHKASFRAVKHHVRELTSVQVDESCSDVSRLCFLSHDPDAYLNANAVELPPSTEVEKFMPARATFANCQPEIETRRGIAVKLLGTIDWRTETCGYCTCPAQHMHTMGDGAHDCEVYLNGAPTIHCFHNSCTGIRDAVNRELRSLIGKAERAATAGKPVNAAGEDLSGDSDEAAIVRLAALSPLDYERVRKTEAERLGCRESVLDNLVSAKRGKKADSALQGKTVIFPEVELWPETVSGADVLNELAETFRRYIALPDGAADVLALWCAHSHGFKAFICSPRLNISSPEKGCGKTTLRDVIGVFVPRPVLTENLSVAVLFRLVEAHTPALLADEYDAWITDNEELRGLLNAGHRRGAAVFRCEGDDNEVRSFAAYAPAVLCGIGALPGTLYDRSIVVRLERAKPAELHTRFDPRHTERERELCRKLARWVADNVAQLESADPLLPDGVFNRLADNWRPLFAIAEIASSDWPQRCATAFAKLTSRDDAEAQGLGVTLLIDIRQVFRENGADRMFSKNLVESLGKMTDRPWPEIQRGKPITECGLASRLRHFGIHSKTLRIDEERAKGYETADFTKAFERYIPAEEQVIRDAVTSLDNGTITSVTSPPNVTDANSRQMPDNQALSPVSRFKFSAEARCQAALKLSKLVVQSSSHLGELTNRHEYCRPLH